MKTSGTPLYWFAVCLILPTSIAIPLRAQDAAPEAAPVTDTAAIKKNLHKHKKDLAEIRKKLAQEKLKKHQAEIKEQKALGQLQQLDQKLGKLKREKEANEEYLQETRLRLDGLRTEMAENQQQLEQSRNLLKQRLRDLYRMSFRRPFLGGILDAQSFGDLTRKLKFEMILAEGNEKLLNQTVEEEERLTQKSDQWNNEENRKKKILSVLGRQENTFSHDRKNRTVFLERIHRQKEDRERVIAELSQAAQDLQDKVSFFLKEAQDAKAHQAAWVPGGRGLGSNRGKLPWPVLGPLLQHFGKEKNAEFKEVVDNVGIQIQASAGTPIKAIAGGTVRFANWFKGYGKLVILDHGEGYYSLYAQAADLNVAEGDHVDPEQVLGTVGDTGSLVGTSLYFEIRKNGIPQNPVLWLKPRT